MNQQSETQHGRIEVQHLQQPPAQKVTVSDSEGVVVGEYALDRSYAILGRTRDCCIFLKDKNIRYRHVYLQVLWGYVLCVDLFGRKPLRWDDGAVGSGWLFPNRSVAIGNHTMRLSDQQAPTNVLLPEGILNGCNPLDKHEEKFGPLPHVELTITAGRMTASNVKLCRLITLIGRKSECPIRFEHKSVSKFHCSLILTPDGLSAIDLMGRDGVSVNGSRTPHAWLNDGDTLTVGGITAQIHILPPKERIEWAAHFQDGLAEYAQPVTPLSDASLTNNNAMISAPFSEDSAPVFGIQGSIIKTVFAVEQRDNLIIVQPTDDADLANMDELRRESVALMLLCDDTQIVNLVVHLGRQQHIGPNLVSVISEICLRVHSKGGRVALSDISESVRNDLSDTTFLETWPTYQSFQEAADSLTTQQSQQQSAVDGEKDNSSEKSSPPKGADWSGTLLKIELLKDALIVVPTIPSSWFERDLLHRETGSLQSFLESHHVQQLIVDLGSTGYSGAELFATIVNLAGAIEKQEGATVLCNASGLTKEALVVLNLRKKWPYFETREGALAWMNWRSNH